MVRIVEPQIGQSLCDPCCGTGGFLAESAVHRQQQHQAIDVALFDLKAVNPRAKKVVDSRTPDQLLADIARKGQEVDAALAKLQSRLGRL